MDPNPQLIYSIVHGRTVCTVITEALLFPSRKRQRDLARMRPWSKIRLVQGSDWRLSHSTRDSIVAKRIGCNHRDDDQNGMVATAERSQDSGETVQ